MNHLAIALALREAEPLAEPPLVDAIALQHYCKAKLIRRYGQDIGIIELTETLRNHYIDKDTLGRRSCAQYEQARWPKEGWYWRETGGNLKFKHIGLIAIAEIEHLTGLKIEPAPITVHINGALEHDNFLYWRLSQNPNVAAVQMSPYCGYSLAEKIVLATWVDRSWHIQNFPSDEAGFARDHGISSKAWNAFAALLARDY